METNSDFIERCYDAVNANKPIGKHYVLVKANSLSEIKICVLAAPHVAPYITWVESDTVATGIGGIVGNKGGVVVGLKLFDTRLAFVSSHLAAHQYQTFRRNVDVQKLILGTQVGAAGISIGNFFHHVFWAGDLNYRLNVAGRSVASTKSGDKDNTVSEEEMQVVLGKIQAGNLSDLLARDQLLCERGMGRVFAGFEEGAIRFPPTFKFETADSYHAKRLPAWCDRVLWKSNEAFAGRASLLTYDSVPSVCTSDHKPVVASFAVTPLLLGPYIIGPKVASLKLSKLKASNLLGGNLLTSFLQFSLNISSHFPPVNTSPKIKTGAPFWLDDEVPTIRLPANNTEVIARTSLLVRVCTWGSNYESSCSELASVGNTQISLAAVASQIGKPVDFSSGVENGGLAAGNVSGVITLVLE